MSGKTKEEIAFELVAKLKGVGVWGENNMTAILDMYAECLEATSGQRDIPGRKPVAKAPPVQPQVQAPVPPQPVLQVQQGQVAPAQQPAVRQQQQMVQQAYQQQAPQTR